MWTLHTLDTSISLEIKNNKLVVVELKNPNQKSNWISEPFEITFMKDIYIGNRHYQPDWIYINSEECTYFGTKVTFMFKCNTPDQLILKSIWWASSNDLGPVQHSMIIENHTGQTIRVCHQDSITLKIAVEQAMKVWYVHKGANMPDSKGVYTDELINGYSKDIYTNLEDSKGDYLVGTTYLHPGLDCLVAMRGPENIILDMMDIPEIVNEKLDPITYVYKEVYNRLYDITSRHQYGTTSFLPVWHPGKYYINCWNILCLLTPNQGNK